MEKLNKQILALDSKIDFVAVASKLDGSLISINHQMRRSEGIPQGHFDLYIVIIGQIAKRLEERYGKTRFFLFNLEHGQVAIFPTTYHVVVVGTRPDISLNAIRKMAEIIESEKQLS